MPSASRLTKYVATAAAMEPQSHRIRSIVETLSHQSSGRSNWYNITHIATFAAATRSSSDNQPAE